METSGDLGRRIAVVGPPHRGKTVLLSLLGEALRARGQRLQVIRTCPDGEGNWSQAADQAVVQAVRVKHAFTREFTSYRAESIRNCAKTLPLVLADLGGRIDHHTERILSACSEYLVLHTGDEELRPWREVCEQYGLKPLAWIESFLTGASQVVESQPVLRLKLGPLKRGVRFEGDVFGRLIELLSTGEQRGHTSDDATPWERLDAAPRTLRFTFDHGTVTPDQLPDLITGLASGVERIELHGGRVPMWALSSIAAEADQAEIHTFDTGLQRLVRVPSLKCEGAGQLLDFDLVRTGEWAVVRFAIPGAHLDSAQLDSVVWPRVEEASNVVLSGQGPRWLFLAGTRTYRRLGKTVGTFDPRFGAVVTFAGSPDAPGVGEVVPLPIDAVRMPKVYFGNAFSGNMFAALLEAPGTRLRLQVERVEPGDVPATATSFHGHPDTALLVGKILGRDVKVRREDVKLMSGDIVYWSQYVGPRLEVGATALPEGAHFVFMRARVVTEQ